VKIIGYIYYQTGTDGPLNCETATVDVLFVCANSWWI